jgi:hypothetical protein
MTFRIGGTPAAYRFKGGTPKEYYFHMLIGTDKTSENVLYFDSAMEEDILLTLYWFDVQRSERGPINAKYQIDNGKLKLYIHDDDLRYMIAFVALKKLRLVRPKRPFYVETEFPCLLHGLVFGGDDLFLLCYHRFCNLFHSRYFRGFQTQAKSMKRLEGIQVHKPLRHMFQSMLSFFGELLFRKKVEEDEFTLNLDSPLTKSIATLCYCLNVGVQNNQQKKSIAMEGMYKYNSIYSEAGMSIDLSSSNFTCTSEQVLNLYKICFAQKNNYGLEVFKNTHFTNKLNNTNVNKGRKKSMIICSWNFGTSSLEEEHKKDKGRYTTLVLQQQYEHMKLRMENYAAGEALYDVPEERKKLNPLLLILDSLLLSKIDDSHLYKKKTQLFYILRRIVNSRRMRNMPLFVPTIPEEEHNNTQAMNGGRNDYYSNSNWVFPMYCAKKMWALESQEWKRTIKKKLKSNKHKF